MLSRLFLPVLLTLVAVLAMPVAAQDLDEAEQAYRSAQYERAESLLRGIVDAQPDNAKASYLLGAALLEQNKMDEAEPRLSRALELNYAQDQVKVALGRIYLQRQQHDRALALLNEAQAANAENVEAYLYRGVARANRNEFGDAVNDLEKAIQMQPVNAKAHYYAGLAYNGLKRPDKMVEHFQMFLKLAPDAPEAARVRSLLRNLR
jgi:tetratricopeptide (TPR) repeat protein